MKLPGSEKGFTAIVIMFGVIVTSIVIIGVSLYFKNNSIQQKNINNRPAASTLIPVKTSSNQTTSTSDHQVITGVCGKTYFNSCGGANPANGKPASCGQNPVSIKFDIYSYDKVNPDQSIFVKSVSSGRDGSYAVSLNPGIYFAKVPSTGNIQFTVVSGQCAKLDLSRLIN